jgi:hypothetical protein
LKFAICRTHRRALLLIIGGMFTPVIWILIALILFADVTALALMALSAMKLKKLLSLSPSMHHRAIRLVGKSYFGSLAFVGRVCVRPRNYIMHFRFK